MKGSDWHERSNDATSIPRRRLLKVGGVGAIAALGGCLSDGETTASPDSGSETTAELRLGAVGYRNLNPKAHEIDVVVSVADQIIHWQTYSVSVNTEETSDDAVSRSLSLSLPAQPASFTVFARVDGTQTAQVSSEDGLMWTTGDIPDRPQPCTRARITIMESGTLEVENWEAKDSVCGGTDATATTD